MAMVVLTIYWVLCCCLLLVASGVQCIIKDESHQFHSYLRSVRIAKYVLGWYVISVSFTLWNKYVLQYWRGGFPFPVFITVIHMTVKLILTRIINRCTPPEKRLKSLPCSKSIRTAIPIGVCTAVDVAFSNLSFLFISVTFYTILKSGTLLWILFWAIIMHLEALTWQICTICALVSGGVSMASYGEASFSWMGFALVTAACCLSGLRWGLTQIMLEESDDGGASHRPLSILYHISPASALSCIPVFLVIELKPFLEYHQLFTDPTLILEVLVVLVTGGLISFLLILAEVKLVKISSSLTMGLFGVCKEFVTVALSIAVFHDQVSILNIIGLGFTVAGVVWYRQYKNVPRPSPHASSSRPTACGTGVNGSSAIGGPPPPAYIEITGGSGIWHLDEDDDEANQQL